MRSLADCRLYGILDLGYVDSTEALRVAHAMIEGGVDIIQLRGKRQSIDDLTELAVTLHKVTSQGERPLIVNDHVEIARRVPVEGVHVGQDDRSVAQVREALSRPIIVGKSTHGVGQATEAVAEGADYIGFGPLFATPTKPDYKPIGLSDVKEVHRLVNKPIFCIGGIKLENLEQVIRAGARRVVIVSGLLQAPQVARYASAAKELLTQTEIKS